jgi:RNA polymerase sigma factor (sigma-70 family)
MTATKTSESIALWQQFKSGDSHAFRIVYTRYYKILLRYGNKISLDTELVMDTVHDLFVNLWNRKNHLSDIDNIEPYLKTSLRHELVRRVADSRSKLSFDDSPELVHQFEISSFTYQHESLEKEETFVRLEKAVQSLSPRVLEALKLRYFDKLGNQEIARRMGINYQSVNNNIHRGVETLRARL